jgi:anti-anti-sigma factor
MTAFKDHSLPGAHPKADKVERGGNITILTFSARGLCDLENVIAPEPAESSTAAPPHLLLNFTNVKYLTSLELGRLVTLHKRMRAAGGQLTLFNLSAEVFKLFTTTRLDTLLTICREVAEPAAQSDHDTHEIEIT